MILEKRDGQSLPDDPTPADAPPSYDELETIAPTAGPSYPIEKSTTPASSPSTIPLPSSAIPGATSVVLPSIKSPAIVLNNNKWSWFTFGQSARTVKEVKMTTIDLLRDIVKQPGLDAAISILESCADAARSYGLSLSSILQERCIEGHSPLYWAVINRPSEPEPPASNARDFISALLDQAAPLSDATISDLRLACLQNSDQTLFQRLKRSAAFSPISGTEEMIFGETVTPDDVDVENVAGDEGAFVVRFRIPMFQKRMRISQEIKLEFIARGRLWALKFYVASRDFRTYRPGERGAWNVSLTLLEHSPPTYIDSRLVIEPVQSLPVSPQGPESPSVAPAAETPEAPWTMPSPPGDYLTWPSSTPGGKPTICLRLKCNHGQIRAGPYAPRDEHTIFTPFKKSLMANSLQYAGNAYIRPDGALHARLEAKLGPRGTECIIC